MSLSDLIKNKENITPCQFYIKKINVKKLCLDNGYFYSDIMSYFYNNKDISIYDINEILRGVRLFTSTVVVHINYRKDMNTNELRSLLLDKSLNKNFVIILTNNNNVKNIPSEVTDLAINYISKSKLSIIKDFAINLVNR